MKSKPKAKVPYETFTERWREETRLYRHTIYHALGIEDREKWTKTPYLAELQVFSCGCFTQAWGHQWSREHLDEGILIYCTDGKGYYRQGGRQWKLCAGDLLYCFPGTAHQYLADTRDPWTIYWMHIRGLRTAIYTKHIGFSLARPVVGIGTQPAVVNLFQTLFTRFDMIHDTTNMLAIQSCASDILGTIAVATQSKSMIRPHSNAVQSVITRMSESLNSHLDVPTLAAMLQLSPSHFGRIFKLATGLSTIQYFNQLKVRKAGILLVNSRLKVKEIAAQLGFEDQYYFSRQFKKMTGFSPGKYRANPRDGSYGLH